MEVSQVLCFGPFVLDVRTGELRKHGIRIRLPEQSLQVLLLLLEHSGEVVLRSDVRLRLWPNDTIVDFDQSISATMRRLRSALGDSADSPRYIETVAKRGYRFIGKLEPVSRPAPEPNVKPAPRYHLLEKLGEGRMGVVYRAEDLNLGRQVAVKFPSWSRGEISEPARRGFEQEARAASALNHPNICTIFGLEDFEGKPGIVMELLVGETLASRLSRGPVPVPEALTMARQIAGALAEAHAAGLVHRDLKPANIMLTRNGAKVLDFGLALSEGTGPAPAGAKPVSRDEEPAGTMSYMSPEQLRGNVLDARSDIFSMGLVFYEMLSARRPFAGENAADFKSAVLERQPAPLGTVPRAVAAIVLRCLAKAPEDRWVSAQELNEELEKVAGAREAPAMPARSSRMLAGIAALGLLAAIAVGLALGYGSLRASRPDGTGPLTISRLTGTGDIRAADISPDGKYVAYVRMAGALRSIWLKQPSVEGDIQLVDCGEDRCGGVTFSPDGTMLYFTRRAVQSAEGTLYRLPVLGGAPETVFSGVTGSPAFSPDGGRVAFVRSSRVMHGQDVLIVRALTGGGEQEMDHYPAPGIQHNTVVWTSDGKRLVYVAMGKLTSMPANGGRAEPVADQNWTDLEDIAPSPFKGSEVLLAGSRMGAPSQLQVFRVPLERAGAIALTHDANRPVGVRGATNGDLLVLEEDHPRSIQVVSKGAAHPVVSTERQNISGQWGVSWTPDGQILFTSRPLANERSDLWLMNADGSDRRRITHSPNPVYYADPVMSPAGNFVVTTVWEPGDRASIWRLDISEGTTRRLTQGAQDFPPALSPDGKWVIYKSVLKDKPVLMKVSSEGGPSSQLTTYACDYPDISPDGKWIACFSASDQAKTADLLILPFTGGPPVKRFPLPSTAKLDVRLAWTPDGGAVSFVNRVDGVGNVWSLPLSGSGAYRVTHFSAQDIFHFDWSPDGRLVLSQGEDITDAMLIHGLAGSR